MGAIVYNEAPYLLEWLAYHQLQGFELAFVGDNDSNDGTTPLLEALEQCGWVHRLFQPRLTSGNAQKQVYDAILKLAAVPASYVAFIDIDEFLLPMGDATDCRSAIDTLLAPPTHAAIGANWRLFGSSGRIEPGEGLVIERFHRCSEQNFGANRSFKSIVKPEAVSDMRAHRAGKLAPGMVYVDSLGSPHPFEKTDGIARDTPSVEGLLRVNHYVVKSFREYHEQKAYRGTATDGVGVARKPTYFDNHDRNETECKRIQRDVAAVTARMSALERALADTVYPMTVRVPTVDRDGERWSGRFGLQGSDATELPLVLTLYADGSARELGLSARRVGVDAAGNAEYRFDAHLPGTRASDGWRLRVRACRSGLLASAGSAAQPTTLTALPAEALVQYRGAVRFSSDGRAVGWVRALQHREPVTVEIVHGDQPVAHAVADQFRADMLSTHKHPSGHCGFSIDLTGIAIGEHGKLRARVQGSGYELPRSS